MKIREELRGAKRVFIDTAPFIYYVEAHPDYGTLTKELFTLFDTKFCQPCSSVITLTELLPKPIQVGNDEIVRRFTELFISEHSLFVVDVNYSIAKQAGILRGKYPWLKTIDSLLLASAKNISADVFITNDKLLRRFPEITILVLEDFI